MKANQKLIVVAVASLIAGAATSLAVAFFRPMSTSEAASPLAEKPGSGETRETFYFESPTDGIAATHNGKKPIQAFPKGIAALDDERLDSAFLLVAKARNDKGEIVGFASEMEDVAPESNILLGKMIMHSTWTLELPGRGTIFCFEVEDASEFAKKVVVPAFTLGRDWNEPWSFVTTVGPRPDGRGVIVGGTGEFEGITGSFVEVTHLRRFTPDGQMNLTMELQLAYRKPTVAAKP